MIQIHGERGLRIRRGRIQYRRTKRTITVAQQDLDLIRLEGWRGQIEVAVMIEITKRRIPNRDIRKADQPRRSKRTIAVAKESLDSGCQRDDEIRDSISVEITDVRIRRKRPF